MKMTTQVAIRKFVS